MGNNILAIDIGGSKLLCGVVTRGGGVLNTSGAALPPGITERALLDTIYATVDALGAEAVASCSSVGVTIPGTADVKSGVWVYACFSGIANVPVAALLHARYGLPVGIENDGNACAWAERVFGCLKGVDNALWVTVSNGIGGGLILNGALYRGAGGFAGEIGHVNVEPGGALCGCGQRGCAEAMAAGPAIARRYLELGGADGCDARGVAARAREGDPIALRVYHDTGVYLGRAVGAAVNLLNLKHVVLGGGVAQSFSLLEGALRGELGRVLFLSANAGVEVCVTALGYNAALLGAAAVAP